MINLKTVTTSDLVQTLDKKFNYFHGWKSTVYSQKDLTNIAYNLIELLSQRNEYIFQDITEVKPEVFEIYLKVVTDIYEGFAKLKTA